MALMSRNERISKNAISGASQNCKESDRISSRIRVLAAFDCKMHQIHEKLGDWFLTRYWTWTCIGFGLGAMGLAAISGLPS